MTTPFWCLLVVSLIPYVLAGTGGFFRARQLGTVDNKHPRQQAAQLEGVGARAVAAQSNAWEALPFFASGVFVAHFAGADPSTSATLSLAFVAARIAHAILYLANLDILRSLVFLASFACVIGLYVSAAGA